MADYQVRRETPVKHNFVGHVNPRCTVCTRTPIDAQRHPDAACERPRPLFDQPTTRKP